MLATTLDKGAYGERLDIWKSLEGAGVHPIVRTLKANCDACGGHRTGVISARTTPVGESWTGSKEAYRTCCDACFATHSVFHNPDLILHDPAYFDEH